METRKEHTYQPIVSEREYYDLEHRSEIREGARKLRRQYLRYKEAEIIYSMSHKKLLECQGLVTKQLKKCQSNGLTQKQQKADAVKDNSWFYSQR